MRLTTLTIACAAALSAAALTVSTTAGRLRADMHGTQTATLTELTVTGTLDARDFRFIADSMPALTALDLSGAAIVPYHHPSVPAIAKQLDFEADALPPLALMGKPLTTLALPATLRTLGEASLAGCSSLKTLALPAQLDSIGPYALARCTALTDVNLPATVTALARGAFAHCTALKSLSVKSGSRLRHIGPRALAGCTALSQLSIGNSIERIGEGALAGTALTALDLSGNANLKVIDGWTAAGAPLHTVQLPPSVTTLGPGTLFNATNVAAVTLPSTVSYIGDYAMAGAGNLQTIVTKATHAPALGDEVWWAVRQYKVTLRVPAGTVNAYSNAYQWQRFHIVEDYILGDVNNDGNVDVGDVNMILTIILNKGTTDAELAERADVNNDGRIDVGDVNAVLAIILANN